MAEKLLRPEPAARVLLGARRRALGDMVRQRWAWPGRAGRIGAVAGVAALAALAATEGATAAGLGLLAIVAGVVAFQEPRLLGPLVAVLLPAGIHYEVAHTEIAPLEAAVGGGALGYLCHVATRRAGVRLQAVHWGFAAFVLLVGLSTLGPAENGGQLRWLLFWGALACVFHAVTTHLARPQAARLLLAGLGIALVLETGIALFEYVDRWSERFSRLHGAIVYPLPQGTLEHPNALAQFLVLAGFAVLALALAERGVLGRAGFVAAGLASVALVVTFSRASWIACAVGVSAYLLERRARVTVLVAGGIAGAAGALLALTSGGAIGARISSLFTDGASGLYDFRLELAGRAARIAAHHPFTGTGHFEEVGVYAGRPDLATHPHNLFLGLAVFFGIPAALAFAALVALTIRAAWRRFRAATTGHASAVGFLALLVALLVNGLFEYPFWNQALATLVVLALAAAAPNQRRTG